MIILVSNIPYQEEEKVHLLDGLLDNSLTFNEVEQKSHQLKAFDCTKEAFVKEIGCVWEEAVEAIPEYANQKVLGRYKVIKGKALPQDFQVKLRM